MPLAGNIYQAARIGADVQAGVSGSAQRIATRATNKFVGRFAVGAVTGGSIGFAAGPSRAAPSWAVGAGIAAGALPGRRALVGGMFELARSLNDLDTLITADPSRLATRLRNKLMGRALIKRAYTRARLHGKEMLLNNINRYEQSLMRSVAEISEHYAMMMEAYAKAYAPWNDRTGQARAGLFGRVREEGSFLYTGVAHTVHYGVYLELGMHGRYAILKPTRDQFAPKYFKEIRTLVRGG